ncbi:hypothetical protein GNX71_29000 [Variovorax sp. RKNM96]|uniref:hypothetical protein n=1 Tax=Variovorax sp. RKNM96 TaxID=2681552 RepID=UPI0019818664|nr:hypothetical protein [Variovorax sp. RKNM96]QSI33388.1 hypothetical protein GNX71_29000 [Variovorax sp. RKNM96]
MTSIVDTSVKHFGSNMLAAPVVNGVAGSLIAAIDACGVNGFDLKNATSLTVAGGVATLAFSGQHSAVADAVITVTGSSIAALNGEQKVTAVGPGVVRFGTAAADGVASGSISFKIAPLGWLKVYSGPNKAVYKSADPTSSGCYLRIDDSGTTFARVVGYESMTDVDTGVGPFPSVAQIAAGGYWAKSSVASAAPTQWLISGDSKAFFFTSAASFASNAGYLGTVTRGFGDPITQKPGGDPYACFLNCSLVSTVPSSIDGSFDRRWDGTNNQTFSPRTHTGLGSAVAQYARTMTGSSSLSSGQDSTLGAFPNECVDGAIRLSRRAIVQVGFAGIRAFVPGVYHIPQDRLAGSFNNFDKFTATDGRRFMLMLTSSATLDTTATAVFGAVPIDVTGPWR